MTLYYAYLLVGFFLGFVSSTVVWFKIYDRMKRTEREIGYLKTQLNTRNMQVTVLRNQLDNERTKSIKG